LSAVELLDGWVRTGQRPSTARVRSAVVRAPGIDLGYLPPDWPTGMP
jgi:hypothetical protein